MLQNLSTAHLIVPIFLSISNAFALKQERIELDNLLFQVRLDEERIKSQALQDSDRYVILIVKRPMIAIRYRLPDGKVADQIRSYLLATKLNC